MARTVHRDIRAHTSACTHWVARAGSYECISHTPALALDGEPTVVLRWQTLAAAAHRWVVVMTRVVMKVTACSFVLKMLGKTMLALLPSRMG